jgi:DNA-binding XRE family transcriptional regulator
MTSEYTPFNDELDALISETPERAAAVAQLLTQIAQERTAFKANLATVRRAADLTQADIAERIGTTQPTISRLESKGDGLYSTLMAYLRSLGAQDPALTVTIDGHRVEIDLASAAA